MSFRIPSTSASRRAVSSPPRCSMSARTRAASWAIARSGRAAGGRGQARPSAAAGQTRPAARRAAALQQRPGRGHGAERLHQASTAPQMASQNGKWPWVAYMTHAR